MNTMKQWMIDIVAECPDADLRKYLAKWIPKRDDGDAKNESIASFCYWDETPERDYFWGRVHDGEWDFAISALNKSIPNWRETI